MILQEFLPDVVQVVLLVLAGLYLINIGVLSAMMFSTLSNIGLTGANTEYILPWDLLGIALCIVLAEGYCLQEFTGCACIFRADNSM